MNRISFAATALASLLALGAAQAQLPPTQNQNGIVYVSGGFGQDESTAFRQAKSQYALALTFATHAEGSSSSPYAADVQVVIRDIQDQPVLNVTSDGPYFLARLQPGSYKVFATYEGQTQSQKVVIKASGTTDIKFTWKLPASGPM
ncbi:carboxypeptidase-like regulatory domain-containing protein [Paracandidimonas lactea]|uniref:carboxypeptidase-like regulatory domain-containing protein n=1 Tax=Paracandidimonas lactea TaxID=2895524 RepID=UPI001928047A|nr:carboxypeptidase-like regulatory domain-containing protein [Paracandidimonas lactea]